MVATRIEAVHMVQLMLKYVSPYTAKQMLTDMDFEIAENTDNESLRDSIKMVLELIDDARTQVTWRKEDPVEVKRPEINEEESKTIQKENDEYIDDTYASAESERRKKDAFKRMNEKIGPLGNLTE
tara:strand:- start:1515 stop:1892 length:378 start_codon:yes stop_codon:yes gene_type:complete